MPTVTVGLPFYDARRFLADAVRSVFAQTWTDWELLLVDDGSTDGSREIAERVRDSRVRLLADGERRRLPARLNQIVAEARGEFVARLDADDMLHPRRLEEQMRLFRARADLDVVSTAMFNFDSRGALLGVGAVDEASADPLRVLRKGLVPHATTTARRAWLVDNRYSERYARAEDRELFARTCRTVVRAHLRQPLYMHCHRKDPAHTLRDYVASSRDNRRLFLDLGAAVGGRRRVIPLLAESFAKEAVFRAVTALGRQDALIRRRSLRPTERERAEAETALERIRSARVPGLEGSRL